MANHKRKKRKSARAGCIMCKPWKANGFKGSATSVRHSERKKWFPIDDWKFEDEK